jgi:hypothetical protein
LLNDGRDSLDPLLVVVDHYVAPTTPASPSTFTRNSSLRAVASMWST